MYDGYNGCVGESAFVAEEFHVTVFLMERAVNRGESLIATPCPCATGFFFLLVHGLIEAVDVNGVSAILGDISSEIEGESKGIVQFKEVFTRYLCFVVGIHFREGRFQDIHTASERTREAFFFGVDDFFDLYLLPR